MTGDWSYLGLEPIQKRVQQVPLVVGEDFPEILDAARSGAEWAWAGIYRDVAPSVVGYVRARGAPDPEDVAGEVFLQVVRDLASFTGDEQAFRSWIFAVAHHRLLDDVRRRARRPLVVQTDVPDTGTEFDDTETRALRNLATERVVQVLGDLSDDQRDVLLLRILGQLTIDEVAGVLGKRSGAVKALQRRGLRAVEKILMREGVLL